MLLTIKNEVYMLSKDTIITIKLVLILGPALLIGLGICFLISPPITGLILAILFMEYMTDYDNDYESPYGPTGR
jgi:hypothetical protein